LLVDSAIPHCCFCQQQHSSQNCQTFAEVESRREALRKAGRCYVCLGKGHVSRNCRSRIKCLSCKGRHHVAICSGKSSPKGTESISTASETTSVAPSSLNPKAPTYTPVSKALWTYSDKSILFRLHKQLHSILIVLLRRFEFDL